jgi:sigma-B regulation protein RsbU (phosphoserine phosphatase)
LRASVPTERHDGVVQDTFADREAEAKRLAAVRRAGVLDTPPDGSFDRVTALAARLFDMPIALVTIVDEDRIWFKSRFGLADVTEIPRDPGLCASAILDDSPYVVEAARSDPRTLANPLVTGACGLQFYAAAPLTMHDGYNIGTLCVIDREPRTFTAEQQQTLVTLAGIVTDEMELRISTARLFAVERAALTKANGSADDDAARYLEEHNIAQTFQHALLPQFLPEAENVQLDALYAAADDRDLVGGDWYDAFTIDDGRIVISIGDVGGHGLGAAVWMGKVSQSLRALSLIESEPHELLTCLDRLLERYEANILITAFVAVLDPKSGELRYSSAGHSPPFVRLADGSVTELQTVGVPLGMPIRLERTTKSMVLEPGTMVLLYTDGLTEATRNVIEGERSVREALARSDVADSPNPAQALRDAVLSRASFDDVAILTIRYGASQL